MRVNILPSVPQGEISAPPSKSIAHRLIICAALAEGVSRIENIGLSDDIRATLGCIKAIGAAYSYDNGTLTVRGTDPLRLRIRGPLDCGECGSTLRFFLPICMLQDAECTLTGSKKLLSRPLGVYGEICTKQGIGFMNDGNTVRIRGKLGSGVYDVPGDISSQFITGLLFALPVLPGVSRISLTGSVESRPYIDLTIRALQAFCVRVRWEDARTLLIPGNQKYTPAVTKNEGDWSNAAFLFALEKCGFPVSVSGVDARSLQGDRECIRYFDLLKTGYGDIDLSNCPDLGPVLFAFAALCHGGRFTGTGRLKLKESDRAEAMAAELRKFGVCITVSENEVIIPPCSVHPPGEVLSGHNDHRIVMSLALLCVKTGGSIDGAEAVNKSYPGYFEDLRKLQVKWNYETE